MSADSSASCHSPVDQEGDRDTQYACFLLLPEEGKRQCRVARTAYQHAKNKSLV